MVKRGSSIELNCTVESGDQVHASMAVFWYLDDIVLDWMGQTGPGWGAKVIETRGKVHTHVYSTPNTSLIKPSYDIYSAQTKIIFSRESWNVICLSDFHKQYSNFHKTVWSKKLSFCFAFSLNKFERQSFLLHARLCNLVLLYSLHGPWFRLGYFSPVTSNPSIHTLLKVTTQRTAY